jgi:hypothetical protein
METQQIEKNILFAERVPLGDRWKLLNSEKVYNSLTEVLNAYFEIATLKPIAYRLEPMNGKLYAIKNSTEPDPEPKKYSIYGDYTI